MSSAITEQVALRLGLASKALPQLSLPKFINSLIEQLGQPLTEKKLRSLTPKKLFQHLVQQDRDVERNQSNQVYAILTNSEIATMQAPSLPDMPILKGPVLQVAVSSNNDEQLDGHFGSCLRFLIYQVNSTAWQLVDIRPVITDNTGLSRTDDLVDMIKDCHMLATLSIGGPAAAKVVRADITPVKKAQAMSTDTLLAPLTQVIANNPPPWLNKILYPKESCYGC